jgi:hypothetical protein
MNDDQQPAGNGNDEEEMSMLEDPSGKQASEVPPDQQESGSEDGELETDLSGAKDEEDNGQ